MTYAARLASCGLFVFALAVPASAAEELVINIDQTQILQTSSKPGTIIIGSPGIVDASMQGGKIFLQGKAYGTTNMILLDRKGGEIANYNVTVKFADTNNVALYKAGDRYTYSCAPVCQAAPQVGDDTNFVFSTLGAQSNRQTFSMQSTSAQAQPTNGSGTSSSGN